MNLQAAYKTNPTFLLQEFHLNSLLDILSLLVNYGELLRLVEAVLGKQEPYAKLQTFLTTNGRRGRRRSANDGHLKPRISTQKANPDSASYVLPNSPDDIELCSHLLTATVTSGSHATTHLQYDLQAKHLDQSLFGMPSTKTPIGRYCPLTVPKYVPPLRSGMPSRPDMTLSSVSNRSNVPSFDHHHRYHHKPTISSSSSSSASTSTSFLSLPLPTSWSSFDTSAPVNGHVYDGDEDYEDGDDEDECMDLRIESKRLSPAASSMSSSSTSIFTTSSSAKDGRHPNTQNLDLRVSHLFAMIIILIISIIFSTSSTSSSSSSSSSSSLSSSSSSSSSPGCHV